MNYKEQLKNPRWQKKRLTILNRDNFTCKLCGDGKTQLHVHHVMYLKNKKVWEYDNSFLETLCSDCHRIVHEIKAPYRDIVEVKKKNINGITTLFIRVEHIYAYTINNNKVSLEMSMSNFQTLKDE